MTSWTLTPPWTKLPLSLNDRGSHWKYDKIIDNCRSWARDAATEALIPPLHHCAVEFIWYVPTNIRRDEDNPVATMKPICDGLVDAGIVPDDTPAYMSKMWPRITYRKRDGGFAVIVTGIETEADTPPPAHHQLPGYEAADLRKHCSTGIANPVRPRIDTLPRIR